MKKVLSVFLCCFVLFNSVVTPASAVKVEEVATFEDAEGHEIRALSYGVAPANAAAGVLYLSSTGGSMGAGVASIASAALPVLGYLLAAGVIVYSVVGLAGCVMDMYELLSADAKAELAEIEAAGADNYTLSEYGALSSELPGAMQSCLSQGGSLSYSFSFDRAKFGVYDFDTYNLNGPATLPGIYNYPLSETPVAVDGTSLEISRVPAPFAGFDGVPSYTKYCLKITNAITGISLYLVDNPGTAQYSFESNLSFRFAAPVIENYINGDGVEQYWFFHFPVVWQSSTNGRFYSTPSDEYNSGSTAEPVYLYFTGTGNAALDGILFVAQNMYNGVTTLKPSVQLHPGMEDVSFRGSAGSIVVSDNFTNVGVTDTPAMPEEEKPIFLPPSVALDNANLLTQSGALTGTWDTTIDGEKVEVEDVPGTDTETGFFESILNWLEGFWDKFVEMLKTALMSLFVPSEGFFEDFIASISATFEDRMGILTYPISLLYEFCNRLLEVGAQEPIFRWPGWDYQGTEFIKAGSFNFNDILKNDTFKSLHDIYLLLVDAGIVFGLLMLAQKKYDSIINH